MTQEVRSHDVAVGLEVPPLVANREETLTVRVREIASGVPLRGASVSFHVGWLDPRTQPTVFER